MTYALWAIAFLLVVLILQLKRLQSIEDSLRHIQSSADRWDQSQKAPLDLPEPKPTNEERQKKDEYDQDRLRQRVEAECGGWQMGRIMCRRETSEVFEYEVVLTTALRTYTARGRLESLYRNGNSCIAQTPQLDSNIRFAVPDSVGKGLGLLLVQNSEGRILSFQLTEERVTSAAQS